MLDSILATDSVEDLEENIATAEPNLSGDELARAEKPVERGDCRRAVVFHASRSGPSAAL